MSWKSRVMSTKKVELGEFVGYGTTYLAQKDMKIAVIPVGYSHGFSRGLSNQGRVLIRGRRHPVVGVVNMNALAVDITDTPEIEKGDEVILIGEEGDVEISVSSFSELSEQLNYELLTRLPLNIPRVVVE
jgi:alanine racemase